MFRNVTYTSPGAKEAINLDPMLAPFNVAVQVFVPAGTTVAYSVEFTLDDLSNSDGSPNTNVRWTTDPQFPTASADTITGNYIVPISAVRVNIASIAGGGVEFKVRQALSIN
ncbi:hypothetical protein [Bradyrhizobium cenepequi]|uniref:hypothetical protein n=1 Tax=Bradyrhizobium cenepequi TaxID=2821403 RepID=UPI001CE341DF|nr:hypothetical protein [Bradyrhizobium cenepequi]MCA6108142.1 hypothetical protein [Bradyrhizobium cenepequi]